MTVHHSKKHRVAKVSEQYSDYFALIAGAIGIAAVVGAVGSITILPAYGAEGLFSLASEFLALFGYSFTWGAALASGAAIVAYSTNQALDAVTNAAESWKDTEVVAFGFAAGFPLAHDAFTFVSDITAGEPVMQVLAVGGWAFAMSYLVDI